ncbi:MAG TPA: FKBP-type peptidyl-prolyl cis-trans isomerase [Solirubrobacterales bacterium]
MKFFISIVLGALLALQVSACGGIESTAGSNSTATRYTKTAENAPESPDEVARANDWGALKRYAGRYSKRLLIPHGVHPTRVVIRDLKTGKGPVIAPNDPFWVAYVSFAYTTGDPFERVWKQPESLVWNINKVVDGWWPGLRGMHEGGIRELIVPSSWAYGTGALVYLVNLKRVEST